MIYRKLIDSVAYHATSFNLFTLHCILNWPDVYCDHSYLYTSLNGELAASKRLLFIMGKIKRERQFNRFVFGVATKYVHRLIEYYYYPFNIYTIL